MPPGTFWSCEPARQGAGAGQTGKALYVLMYWFSWPLFLTSRPSALRGKMGSRPFSVDPVMVVSPGTNVSAGTPDPYVYIGESDSRHGISMFPNNVSRFRSSVAAYPFS